MSHDQIPFNRPTETGLELDYMTKALRGGHTASSGPFTKRASDLLKDEIPGVKDVLLTTSCTDALEMTALMLDIGPGDTVIVPSFTFVTSALAFARQGARIRFCDIDDQRLGLDPTKLGALMDETVKAVVVVHYAGIPCLIDEIVDVVAPYNCAIVEDNAHGLFGAHKGRPLGTFGTFATLSFHETKNFICGEGGALLLNEQDQLDRAHTILDKGTNRRQFLLGQVDKYSWSDTGSSFGMSDLLAAFLLAQLECKDDVLHSREQVAQWYFERLSPIADDLTIDLPFIPVDCQPAFHMFYVKLDGLETRNAVLGKMAADGIKSTFHYIPLDTSPAGQQFGDMGMGDCPVTASTSDRLLRLPYFTNMTENEVERSVASFVAAAKST